MKGSAMPLTGGCQCGAIRFRVEGRPRDIHYCHCSMCRRAVGNAFATLVWLEQAMLTWTGAAPAIYASSKIADRGFCRRCGSPLFLRYGNSSQIALMAGSFDDPAGFRPSHHYGIEARLPWADIGASLPGYPTDADPRPHPRGDGPEAA
jgi:hypothetical protein